MAALYLADDDETIRKKVMKIKSDMAPSEKNSVKSGPVQNLFLFMKLVSTDEIVEKYEAAFNNCTIRYGDMKKQLAEDMVNFITPIRKRVNEILDDETYLKNVMKAGAEKAVASAEATMQVVRKSMRLDYF
jgi:tryptophanyl-tRNA synthetase